MTLNVIVLVPGAVHRGAGQVPGADPGLAPPREPRHDRARGGLDRHQQRDLPRAGPAAARRARARGPVHPRVVPRGVQPPVVGRHPGAAGGVQPAHPVPQVLPQAAADLGAVPRAGVVGARLPVHAPLHRGAPREASGGPRQGPRGHAPRLREVPADPDVGDEFRRRHALHAGQARRVQVAVPAPAAAPRRRRVVRAVGDGRHAALDARRHARLHHRPSDPVGHVLRPRRHGAGGRAAGGRSRRGCRRATTAATRRSARGSSSGSAVCGPTRTRCSTGCCRTRGRELGPAVAVRPRAGGAPHRDRRLRARQQRHLHRLDGRLRLGAFDRAQHSARDVPRPEPRHGGVAYAGALHRCRLRGRPHPGRHLAGVERRAAAHRSAASRSAAPATARRWCAR